MSKPSRNGAEFPLVNLVVIAIFSLFQINQNMHDFSCLQRRTEKAISNNTKDWNQF